MPHKTTIPSISISSLYHCISLVKNIRIFIQKLKLIFLIKTILSQRTKSLNLIQSSLETITFRKKLLISMILSKRLNKIIFLQNFIRSYQCYSHFKRLLSSNYIFFYNYPYKKSNNLELYLPSYKKTLHFNYSKYLDQYYVSINNVKCIRKKIPCIFSINNTQIIESKYEVIMNSQGKFLNLLYSSMIYKKKKNLNPHKVIKEKKWEKFFTFTPHKKRKISLSSCSSISDELRDQLLINQKSTHIVNSISILKNKYHNINEIAKDPLVKMKKIPSKGKRVSFSKNIYMLYQYSNIS